MTTHPELPAGRSGADSGRHAQNGGPGRVGRPDLPEAVGRAAIVAGTAFVAVTAFVLAYDGSRGAAVDAGIQAAAWYPFCIEGVIVCASVATLALARRAYPWVILLLFSAVSVAANVLHAWQHPGAHLWSLAFAAVPPLALPICVHLLLMVVRPRAHLETGEPVSEPAAEGLACWPGEPVVEPLPGRLASPVESVGEPASKPLTEPLGEPASRPEPDLTEPASEPRSEPAGEPARLELVSPTKPARRAVRPGSPRARRAAGKPARPDLQDCGCGLDYCPGAVPKSTRTAHWRKVREAAELAARAQSNGHREPAGVSS